MSSMTMTVDVSDEALEWVKVNSKNMHDNLLKKDEKTAKIYLNIHEKFSVKDYNLNGVENECLWLLLCRQIKGLKTALRVYDENVKKDPEKYKPYIKSGRKTLAMLLHLRELTE